MADEISVYEKDHPSVAATGEAQAVEQKERIVVPPPTYTDPNNPAAAAGSVNMAIHNHPLVVTDNLSDDYGSQTRDDPGHHVADNIVDLTDDDLEGAAVGGSGSAGAPPGPPEDRSAWKKEHWRDQARELGLAVSGNMDQVKERVEDYEALMEDSRHWNAGDWHQQIESADNTDDLDDLRTLYERSGADYTTVPEAFDNRERELAEQQ